MSNNTKFGTFGGVFVPSILTILGVIMYLRVGWVVGNAGLYTALIIIILAHVVSVTTGLSISSVSTDREVKGGGVYYMLSRSLGLPIGGSIGIALYFATAFSIAMYIVGFAESFNDVIGFSGLHGLRITGTIVLCIIAGLALISTSLAIKTQYYALALIALSLISVFAGGFFLDNDFELTQLKLWQNSDGSDADLMMIFGIFFPAVTGFTAGVAMSGDLEDPKKSIPRGTMWAIGTGLIVYISLTVFLGTKFDAAALKQDNNILSKISLFAAYGGPLVLAGIWCATLSSAMGSILGAPRILQAMSLDKIVPQLFAKGEGEANEPRRALIPTFIIAECGVLIGELDVIAPLVAMIYLAAYGFINLSCALESWTGSDFKPTFKIPNFIPFVGAIATFGIMFQLNVGVMLAAFLIMSILWLIITRRQVSMNTRDVWQGVWSELIRTALFKVDEKDRTAVNFKPNIILFSGGTEKRPYLVSFGKFLVGRLGLLSNFDLIEDKGGTTLARNKQLGEGDDKIKGIFTRKYYCENIFDGIETIASTYGFSGVEPNTVLMGWGRYSQDIPHFINTIKTIQNLDLNLLLMDYDSVRAFGEFDVIDLWWSGNGNDHAFALSVIRFLLQSKQWRHAKVRLIVYGDYSLSDKNVVRARASNLFDKYRVDGRVILKAYEHEQDVPLYDIIREESKNSALIWIDLPNVFGVDEEIFFRETDLLCKDIGTVVLYAGFSGFESNELIPSMANFKRVHEEPQEMVSVPDKLPALNYGKQDFFKEHFSMLQQHGVEALHFWVEHALRSFKEKENDWVTQFENRINNHLSDKNRFSNEKNFSLERDLISLFQRVSQHDAGILKTNIEEQFEQVLSELKRIANTFNGMGEIVLPVEDALNLKLRLDRIAKLHFREVLPTILIDGIHKQIQWDIVLYQKLMHNISESFFDKTINEKEYLGQSAVSYSLNVIYNNIVQFIINEQKNKFQQYLDTARRQLVLKKYSKEAKADISLRAKSLPLNVVLDSWKNKREALFHNLNIHITLSRLIANFVSLNEVYFHDIVTNAQEAFTIDKIQEVERKLLYLKKKDVRVFNMELNSWRSTLLSKEDLNLAVQNLVQTLSENMVINVFDLEFSDDFKTKKFKIKELLAWFFENKWVDPIYISAGNYFRNIEQAQQSIDDIVSISSSTIAQLEANQDPEDADDAILDMVNDQLNVLDIVKKGIENSKAELQEQLVKSELALKDEVNIYNIEKSFDLLDEKVRIEKQKKRKQYFFNVGARLRSKFDDVIVSAYLGKSKSLIKSELRSFSEDNQSHTLALVGLINQISIDARVESKVPPFLLRLVSSMFIIPKDLYVERPADHLKLEQLLGLFDQGKKGAVAILGESFSGKSTLVRNFVQSKYPNAYFVKEPRLSGNLDMNLIQQIKRTIRFYGNINNGIKRLPKGSIIVFDNVENWWCRNEGALDIIKTFKQFVNQSLDHVRIVFIFNQHKFDFYKRFYDLENLFVHSYFIKPFDAETLMKVLDLRMKSLNPQLTFHPKKFMEMTKGQKARYFDSLFNASMGLPGVALHYWKSSIKKVDEYGVLYMMPLVKPISFDFGAMQPSKIQILSTLLLHNKLEITKLNELSGVSEPVVREIVSRFIRIRLLKQDSDGSVSLNRILEPIIVESFRKCQIIVG